VTVSNDDGRVPWTDLRAREKLARGTQQSFNLLVIVAGLGLTVRLPPPSLPSSR
jgi:import inner membrane translocase subunit TIM21